jgi:hypothetical protein
MHLEVALTYLVWYIYSMKLNFPAFWSKKKNKLPLDITPHLHYTSLMNETAPNLAIPEKLLFPSNPIQLASALTGKTVVYHNAKASTVTPDKVRVFKVRGVEDVFTSEASGAKCVTVSVNDIDDGGSVKYRTLHINGIQSAN